VITVSGSRPNAKADRQAFQDIDQAGMAKPVAKWTAQPFSPAQIPFYVGRAFAEATTGRMGPVHLTIPVDVFTAEVDAAPTYSATTISSASPSACDVRRAMELLRRSERPLIIAGSGTWWADAGPELHQFIERESLPLFTVGMARGLVRDDHALCFGYADPALNRASHAAFQEADLILVLGKRIDFRLDLGSARVLPASASYIQVDIHPQELGMNRALDLAICADVKQTLRAFLGFAGPTPLARKHWLSRLSSLRKDWREALKQRAADKEPPIHPAACFAELVQALPPDTLLSWDGGDFTHWGRTFIPALHAGGWLRLGPLATIGAALPNGIALKIANPNKPVAVITGDGALGFYIAELDTAVRLKLPLVLIVENDAGWGLERELQNATEGSTVACELRSTRYDRITEAFGGAGETIDSIEQIAPAIRRAFQSAVPYCINAQIRGARSPFTEWTLLNKRP
jgi:acetolactate synthase-1/2/3 large subunit